MCESNAYLEGDGEPELILKDVTTLRPEGDGWVLVTLFGEKREIKGRLKLIDLLGHRIVFTEGKR